MDHEKFRNMHGGAMSSMKKAEFQVALKSKRQIAEGTWAFTFEKPEGFVFKAGQHIRMTLLNPAETDTEGNSRFFSPACTPQDADLVIAMRMRDTAFKRSLSQMKIGEKVLIQILLGVPHGAFALHDDSSRPAVFLAGGIGIAAAYSMIKDATERKLPHKLILFYSNRRPEDAPFLAELQDLAKQNPNFKLIATMTEPDKSGTPWQDETGRIDRRLLTKYVSDLKEPVYYIAGLPKMASAMRNLLKELGVSEDNIKVEEFSGFDLNKISDDSHHHWKRHALFVVAALVVIAIVVAHIVVGDSLYASNILSLKNPLIYLLVVVMLVIAAFKFKHLRSFIGKK